MENYAAQDSSSEVDVTHRPLTQYHPNLWGDHFLHYHPPQILPVWRGEAAILLEKLKDMLHNVFTAKKLGERLKLIDTIQRLGIAYHFEEEIHRALDQILHDDDDDDDDDSLLISTLRFRLLREHGYKVSCDVFNKFKDDKNSFKTAIKEASIEDLLNLYEATYLRVHEEEILDEALELARTKLEELKVSHNLKPSIAKQVLQATSRPMRKALPRLLAREHISFYQEDEFHNEIILKFAKLDFNILQQEHQEELSVITKWWRSLDVPMNFSFARDRITECYFWILGVYYEPQYAFARKLLTKFIAMASIIDDIYDAYGTQTELELFTQTIQRLEISSINELPEYMKIYCKMLLQVYDEMEEELSKKGRSFAIHYAKDEMKYAVKAQYEESKWRLQRNNIPTVEEYMKIALDSSFYQMLIAVSFVGMGENATKEAFQWVNGKPPMVRATTLISRLMDDIVSHQYEQQREHAPSAVECYMHQHGVSEKEACDELNKQVEDAWKDINQGFFDAESPPRPLLMRILNLARVMELLYKEDDCYTNSTKSKNYLISSLVDQVEL